MEVLIRGASGASTAKGIVKRTVREEMRLRERLMSGRYVTDAIQKLEDELADRMYHVGPVDLRRNLLRSWVKRRARAYLIAAFAEGISERFAKLIGDLSPKTTIARYAKIGGRPLPTRLAKTSARALDLRMACNWTGTLVGWSDRSRRPYVEALLPSNLAPEYTSHDPFAPTTITHFRVRVLDGEEVEVREVYDLTDLDQPRHAIYNGDEEITEQVYGVLPGPNGWDPLWRYQDGRPFHRIVISGDPHEPYTNVELAEASLSTIVDRTCYRAGLRDAGFPLTHAIGLELMSQSSKGGDRGEGLATSPTTIPRWAHINPERPGSLVQMPPGFDPEGVGRAVRVDEMATISALDVPINWEQTGGEPTESEARAMREIITATYTDCREHDGLVMRRMAAMHNRATELADGMEPANLPERAWPTLYREEIDEAMAAVEPPPVAPTKPPEKSAPPPAT